MKLPIQYLAYPILLEFPTPSGNSLGTGFFLKKESKTYLISAKHVFFDAQGQLHDSVTVKYQGTDDQINYESSSFEIDILHLADNHKIAVHPSFDVIVLDLFDYGDHLPKDKHHYGDSITINSSTKSFTQFQDESIKTIDDINVSDEIHILGYPTSIGIPHDPQFDFDKPLLRRGIVSQIYKTKGTIIFDCQVHPGNSGGAVIQISSSPQGRVFNVIGVVIQFIPYVTTQTLMYPNGWISGQMSDMKNSGYSVAVAMDYVLETINLL